MNRGALKNFAVRARAELVRLVGQAACRSDAAAATGHDPANRNAATVSTVSVTDAATVETVAYTWFIRLLALRFMEAKGYLEAVGGIEGDTPAALRSRAIERCRAMQTLADLFVDPCPPWTERWLPEALWAADGFARRLAVEIPAEEMGHVEILGWLHQFYWAERKDEVFTQPASRKIAEADIPAATQLFTPRWIVRFMVENSLGRLLGQLSPQTGTASRWRYALPDEEEKSSPPAGETTAGGFSPDDRDLASIRLLDPACGAGHILVYAFDLLADGYERQGVSPEAYLPVILEKNLAGLDVDERAARLAAFALLMKARERSPSVLQRALQIRVYGLQETRGIDVHAVAALIAGPDENTDKITALLSLFEDASHFGSLLRPERIDFDDGEGRIEALLACCREGEASPVPGTGLRAGDLRRARQALRQGRLLTDRYDVVITNPPYMGIRNMNGELREFLRRHYPQTKGDLFAAFMERMESLVAEGGYHATVTMQSWMFLATYEAYRRHLLQTYGIVAMVHMANMVMGIAFGTVATVLRKGDPSVAGTIVHVDPADLEGDEPRFFPPPGKGYRHRGGASFLAIAGSPIAYWIPEAVRQVFTSHPSLSRLAAPRQGLATADNDRFLRRWHEVALAAIGFDVRSPEAALVSGRRWIPYNKGGRYRKWYGNQEYVIDWADDGRAVRQHRPSVIRNRAWYFREGITWSFVSSSKFGVRYTPQGFIFDVGGSSLFPEEVDRLFLLAFLCSNLSFYLLKVINPTLNFQVGNIAALPVPACAPGDRRRREIERLAAENVQLARADWDDRELSWRFAAHPFLTYRQGAATLAEAFARWQEHAEGRFRQMRANEERINALFLQVYGLSGELSPEVAEADITLARADRGRDGRSFLSYAVGCILGRYSLDRPGLAYAGGLFEEENYGPFRPVPDGILPVDDRQGGGDDALGRLRAFLIHTFGEGTVEENLNWLADALRRRGGETAEARLRRYFRSEYYGDHLKMYHKRPIYWLFSSTPRKAFQAFVYLHRFGPDTLERLRQDHIAVRLERALAAVRTSGSREESFEGEKGFWGGDPVVEEAAFGGQADFEGEDTVAVEAETDEAQELAAYAGRCAEFAQKGIALSLDDGVIRNYERLRPLLANLLPE
ncbi:BREX-1 system adenine-specific DNA-methyltransferase PglX [Heliobacterium gestii]|uniref:site-specific DNA-methyltransferase (adenine-specific) n=1 Tax=Heliomicrobium gestii TaxID=2699 RepID=A0A845L815_HELGE|nr:BREX-1 system adenine-specific DNA-methyltransferase PglX [Heliomicrobium gestii]MBM7866337.1 hypothetical protein [Heliomicrobium gestii]MZP42877.1 BREX-1 system adenine-specific DNA-methyltransferase PglX [Heliomicrobium gestii]